MRKRLIINADDFGVSPDINRGIIECLERGAATDVSLLAGGGHFEHAVELAHRSKVTELGIHLALSGSFKALGRHDRVAGLVDANGLLPRSYPQLLAKYFSGAIGPEQIYTELKAQVARIKKTDLTISHLDSHEHVHMFPPILKLVLRIMSEEGIRRIRFPLETVRFRELKKEPLNTVRYFALRAACRLSKPILRKTGIVHNDGFIGHFHAHRLNSEDFFSSLRELNNGLTELGCHPGYFGQHVREARPWYRLCETELGVLLEAEFIKAADRQGIELVSYSQIDSATG